MTIVSSYLKFIKIFHVQVTKMSLADKYSKGQTSKFLESRKTGGMNNFAPVKSVDVIV